MSEILAAVLQTLRENSDLPALVLPDVEELDNYDELCRGNRGAGAINAAASIEAKKTGKSYDECRGVGISAGFA